MRREDLEVARHDRDLDVGAPHRPHELEHLLVACRPTTRGGPVDLVLVDDLARSSRGPRIGRGRRSSPSPSRKPTTSSPYSGCAWSLRWTSRASSRRRRSACAEAHHAGKTQLRIVPRTMGTNISAAPRKSELLDRGVDPPVESTARPARGSGSRASRPAWRGRYPATSSKLETEIRWLSFSYRCTP